MCQSYAPRLFLTCRGLIQLTRKLFPSCYWVQLSSDQVYDGDHAPFTELSPTSPVNVYGETKLRCEQFLSSSGLPHCILRSSLIYGPPAPRSCKKLPFNVVLEKCLKAGRMDLFSDEFRSAIFVHDVTSTINAVLRQQVQGVLNVGGPERLSRLDMGLAVAAHFALPPSRAAASSRRALNDAPTCAVRSPLDISMDSTRAESVLGRRMTRFVDALASVVQP
jgi:dTDP-4-dehydrorhamnose reductase